MSDEILKLNKEEVTDTEQSPDIKIPKLSANALFNFMKEYSYLEETLSRKAFLPRYYPEDVEYLKLKYAGQKLNEWYIPMTCFCDIPLHQISYHAEGTEDGGYGKFAIALHKQFGIEVGIQPIQYLNDNSFQCKQISETLSVLFSHLTELSEKNEIYVELTNQLLEQIRIIKPLSGKMKIIENSQEKTVSKNFHDEHEWRYIPQFEKGELPDMLVDKDQILARDTFTNSVEKTRHGLLHFGVSDVRYIFVDTVSSRDRLIAFIKAKKGRWLSKNDKEILISKIMIYSELREDW